jgi:segregation and condensation protein B
MENPNLDNIVLALLFAADEPLSARKLAATIEDVTTADVKEAIDKWNARADQESWSIAIEQVAGGYRLATRPEYASYVSRLYQGRRRFRLSRAGLETLAIIAYKQPITRAEIESIRGVGAGSVVANLMERSLIEITGKAKVLGAPFLYGTTPSFLEYLGLNSLKDLPSMEDLEALLASENEAVEGEEALPSATSEEAVVGGDTDASAIAEIAAADDTPRALAERAASAKLGPRVDEPVNRPLYEEITARLRQSVDEEEDDGLDAEEDDDEHTQP